MNKQKSFDWYRFVPYVLIIIATFLFLIPQITRQVSFVGFDTYFHMSRTYDTAMQIKTGHFSYFLSLFNWHGCGRIVNAIYGPLFGYLSGLILLLVHSWYHWEIAMDFIVFSGCGCTMYKLGKYWKCNPLINLIISIIYITVYPVFSFAMNTSFTAVGAIFLPLVALIASKALVTGDVKVIPLTLLIVIIANTHLLTLLISILFLLPCFIVAILWSKNHERIIRHLAESVFLTLILTVNVWGATLEVVMSNKNHFIPTFPADSSTSSNSYSTITFSNGNFSILGTTLLLVFFASIIIWILIARHIGYIANTFIPVGAIFLWLSTAWFPWHWAQIHIPFISIIQFPKRFLLISVVILLLFLDAGFSQLFQDNHIMQAVLLIILCVIGVSSWENDTTTYYSDIHTFESSPVITWLTTRWMTPNHNHKILRKSLSSNDPGKFMEYVCKPTPDYLPTGLHFKQSKYQQYGLYSAAVYQLLYPSAVAMRSKFSRKIINHGIDKVKIKSNKSGKQQIPFVKYNHTHVTLNHHQINPSISNVGAMKVHLRRGINTLTMQYQPSNIFKFGIFIEIIGWLLLVYGIYVHQKDKYNL